MAKPTRKKPSKKKVVKKSTKPKRAQKAPSRSSHPAGMHDAREVVHERRFEVRSLITNMTFAALSFQTEGFGKADFSFNPDLSGLLVDTSVGGCSLIFMQGNPFAPKLVREAKCIVQIAPAEPRLATVRWVKDLDGRLRNAGFAFG